MGEGWEQLIDRVRLHLGLTRRGPYAGVTEDRVTRVAATWGVASGTEALLLLEDRPHLLDELVDAVVIPETMFFREPRRLHQLIEEAVSTMLPLREPDHALRVWSAGCSTGEESYTLAMMLRDNGLTTARVLGTDVSRSAIGCADEGLYRSWSFRGVADGVLDRHFDEEQGRFRVRAEVRQQTSFAVLNLVTDPYPRYLDVILCRNVLVYMEPEVQRAVIRRLAMALAPGGWLMTAATDPLLHEGLGLQPVRTAAGLLYRRPVEPSRPAAPHRLAREARTASSGGTAQGRRPTPSRRTARHRSDPEPSASAAQERSRPPTQQIRSLMADGRGEEAAVLVEETVHAWPLEPEPRYLQAVLALDSGRPEDAVRAAAAAIYLDPDLAAVHILLGQAQRAVGDGDRAARSWARARELLRAADPAAPVPFTDEEPAGRLLGLLDGVAARAGTGYGAGGR